MFTMGSSLYCMGLVRGSLLSLETRSLVGTQAPARRPVERSMTCVTGTRQILVVQSVNCIARFASIPIISARTLSGWKSPVQELSVRVSINKAFWGEIPQMLGIQGRCGEWFGRTYHSNLAK